MKVNQVRPLRIFDELEQIRRHLTDLSPVTQVPDGFIAHFYAVCEQISPVLAWGFLGPKSSLHDFCCFFKVRLNTIMYLFVFLNDPTETIAFMFET